MRNPAVASFTMGILFAWLGLDPGERAQERVRRADRAYRRGDYEAAVSLYRQAECDTTDPGLVAFNKAGALFRLSRYTEAERSYLCSREGASGPRLARVQYNLGNCIVQESGGQDAALLERAIGSYEECLAQSAADNELRALAGENLRIARALRQKALAARSKTHPGEQEGSIPEHDAGGHPLPMRSGDEKGMSPRRQPADSVRAEGDEVSTREAPPPGAGNLLPVPDEDQVVPLSPEEAAAYIQQAMARISRARREARQRQRRETPGSLLLKDW